MMTATARQDKMLANPLYRRAVLGRIRRGEWDAARIVRVFGAPRSVTAGKERRLSPRRLYAVWRGAWMLWRMKTALAQGRFQTALALGEKAATHITGLRPEDVPLDASKREKDGWALYLALLRTARLAAEEEGDLIAFHQALRLGLAYGKEHFSLQAAPLAEPAMGGAGEGAADPMAVFMRNAWGV